MRFASVVHLLCFCGLASLAVAQQSPPLAQGDMAACRQRPTSACVAEMALEAAQVEREGWAVTSAFEAFIQNDPDPARRDEWMRRYEAWAAAARMDDIKDRIVPVRAEHRARKGDFDGAYKELGLEQANPETLGDPSTLILDEARAGHVKTALGRIDRLVEAESRDDIRLEMLDIAAAKSAADMDAVVGAIKNTYLRRLGLAFAAGLRGDVAAIAPQIDEWVKTARTGKPAPFDEASSARAESWDSFLRGAVAARNFDSFKAGLAKRGAFNQTGDGESAGRLLRILIREGRADWVRAMAPALALPKDEPLQVEEDLAALKEIPPADLAATVEAADGIEATNHVITDLAVEMLAARGDVTAALNMFEGKGRLAELNRGKYDQERVGITFETLWRAALGRGDEAAIAALRAAVTSEGAKDYMARIDALRARMKAILAGDRVDEPSEDEWAVIAELAQASDDPVVMVKVADAIREPGLRSSVLAQIARLLWERRL